MNSLLATQAILFCYRKLHVPPSAGVDSLEHLGAIRDSPDPEQTGQEEPKSVEHSDQNQASGESCDEVGLRAVAGLSMTYLVFVATSLIVSVGLYIAAIILKIFEVESTRGTTSVISRYSILSIGQSIPRASLEPNSVGIRFIQFMWYFLVVAVPIWYHLVFLVLYFAPLSKVWLKRVFILAEMAFIWSCAEVLLVSTIFAVWQLPTFGAGLVHADCNYCFVVNTKLLSPFAIFCVAVASNVIVFIVHFRKARILA